MDRGARLNLLPEAIGNGTFIEPAQYGCYVAMLYYFGVSPCLRIYDAISGAIYEQEP